MRKKYTQNTIYSLVWLVLALVLVTFASPTYAQNTGLTPELKGSNPRADVVINQVNATVTSIKDTATNALINNALTSADLLKIQKATQSLIKDMAVALPAQDKKIVLDLAIESLSPLNQLFSLKRSDDFVVWSNAIALEIGKGIATLTNLEHITTLSENTTLAIRPISVKLLPTDKRIEKTIALLLNSSLSTLSTEVITPIEVKNGLATIQIDASRTDNHAAVIGPFQSRIEAAYFSFSNGQSVHLLKRQLHYKVDLPNSATGVTTTILPNVANSIKSNGYEALVINVRQFAASVPLDLIDDQKTANLSLLLKPSTNLKPENRPKLPLAGNQSIITYESGTVLDLKFSIDGKYQAKLTTPMSITLPLDQFSFKGNTSVNQIAIYRYFPNLKGWRAVGGIFNPLNRSFTVQRDNLSEYTLLKSTKSFSDIQNSNAKTAIQKMLNKGIVPSAKVFKPKSSMSRQEFALWLTRAYGLENTKGRSMVFSDVSSKSAYYNAILIVTSEQIIPGRSAKSFNPNAPVTKLEMVRALAITLEKYQGKRANLQRAAQLLATTKNMPPTVARSASLLQDLGVFSSKDLKNWNSVVTREQVASFLSSVY